MLRRLHFLALCAVVLTGSAGAQNQEQTFFDVYARLGFDLPQRVASDSKVLRHLNELKREPCDQRSIGDLARVLDDLGYRREAAEAQYNFVLHCGAPVFALHRSIEIFLRLTDYKRAFEVAEEYLKREPTNNNAHYLRGLAFQGLGEYRRALIDYANGIALFGPDKKEISSRIFMRMADAYAALGEYCEAATPIQTWVALDPARRDSTRTQKMIADYEQRGNCATSRDLLKERYPLSGPSRVVTAPVLLNGVRGNFIIDTGASFVSVKSAFADRAKIPHAQANEILLSTAAGQTKGRLSKAEKVQLGKLEAVHVPVVVQTGDTLYGPGIDGLLGMSFLSRFEVQMAGGFVEIRTRSKK
jgi:clan AA aspartic protease (TIGR02281 family)